MKNLFLVHTQYHLLLSIGIILEKGTYDNDILIYDSLNLKNINVEKLYNVFKNIMFYNSEDMNNYINIPKLKTLSSNINRKIKINKLIDFNYKKVFIFNDSILETQYIINKLYKKSEIIYVEDGSVIYLGGFRIFGSYENILSKLKKYLLYGFDYEFIYNAYGIYSKIDKKMVIWPDLICNDFKKDGKPITEIKKSVLIDSIRYLYSDMTKFINFKKDKYIILIILEHEDFFKRNDNIDINDFENYIEFILRNLSSCYDIYVKYHPRDNSKYLQLLSEKYKINFIEKDVPVEVFYVNDEVYVLSITSTALFTAKKILDNSNVISLCKLLCLKDLDMINKFEKINIKLPSNDKELLECFEVL